MLVRSSHGFSNTNIDAELVWLVPRTKLKPAKLTTYATAGCLQEVILDPPGDFDGPLERGAVGQLDDDAEVALVFGGDESAGHPAHEHRDEHQHHDEQAIQREGRAITPPTERT